MSTHIAGGRGIREAVQSDLVVEARALLSALKGLVQQQVEVLSKQDVLATPAPTACVTSFTYTGSARLWNAVCVNSRCDCQAGRLDLARDSFHEAFLGLRRPRILLGRPAVFHEQWGSGGEPSQCTA